MVQRFTIFDEASVKEAFAVGETIEVVVGVEEKDVEDYYYLQDFVRLKGRVARVLPGLQYEVLFVKNDPVGILWREREGFKASNYS